MDTIVFDRLTYTETLKRSGIDEAQAIAHANALDTALKDSVATKHDIEQLRVATKHDIGQLKSGMEVRFGETKHDIEQLRAATRLDIEQLKSDMEVRFGETKHDIEQLREATKHDIEQLREANKHDLDVRFAELAGETKLNRWMLALVIAATVIPLIRDFL